MRKVKLLIGTFFGAGLLPAAPGTWGSLAALPVAYLMFASFGIWALAAVLFSFIGLSLATADTAVEKYGNDPDRFVIDECAGQALVLVGLPLTGSFSEDVPFLASAFILFRFFDILKPLGINRVQLLDGKIGILADDLLAGLYALICIRLSELVILNLF